MVLPSNIRVDDHKRIKKRKTYLKELSVIAYGEVLAFVFDGSCSPNDRKIHIDCGYLHYYGLFGNSAPLRLPDRTAPLVLFLLFVVNLPGDIIRGIRIKIIVCEKNGSAVSPQGKIYRAVARMQRTSYL